MCAQVGERCLDLVQAREKPVPVALRLRALLENFLQPDDDAQLCARRAQIGHCEPNVFVR